MPDPGPAGDPALARRRMVREQIAARGVRDPRVLAAMEAVPRHLFVDPLQREAAYGDHALPIGGGQTISQPYIVARMVELLDAGPQDRVLEVGAGSGYEAAVLARLAGEVYAVEIVPSLAARAEARLRDLGADNVHVEVGDGSLGLPEHAPYDGIVVAAGAPEPPEPLLAQLAEGGRLVIPVGDRWLQVLRRYVLRGGRVHETRDIACHFVPLLGAHGWQR